MIVVQTVQRAESHPAALRRGREGRRATHADVHRESDGRSDDQKLLQVRQTFRQGRRLHAHDVQLRRRDVLRLSSTVQQEEPTQVSAVTLGDLETM